MSWILNLTLIGVEVDPPTIHNLPIYLKWWVKPDAVGGSNFEAPQCGQKWALASTHFTVMSPLAHRADVHMTRLKHDTRTIHAKPHQILFFATVYLIRKHTPSHVTFRAPSQKLSKFVHLDYSKYAKKCDLYP